ncbi:MAG: Holliday junction resolvase-like protein, partial [Candidatus Aenigmatarchaeota archaeon]
MNLYWVIALLALVNIILLWLLIQRIGREKEIRREAIEKSRVVLEGKFREQLAPLLPEFRYNPTDARFLGSPIDFVVFDGICENGPREVVFIEVKSGKSRLS